jgi:DNA-binding winged helix-turn-helix (wHTH) protein
VLTSLTTESGELLAREELMQRAWSIAVATAAFLTINAVFSNATEAADTEPG